MLMLNTNSSALYSHYYFHEHTELCCAANTCKPPRGMIYLLTDVCNSSFAKWKHNNEKLYAHM